MRSHDRYVVGTFITVVALCFLRFPSQGGAADDIAVKMSPENLGKVMEKLISGTSNLSVEEREELLQYSTRKEVTEEHAGLLLKVLQVSLGKLSGQDKDKRGTEASRYADRIKAHIRDHKNPELQLACYAVLVYGVEDKANGVAAEDEYFNEISKATGERRVELIEIIGNTKWPNVDKRLGRLKEIYESEQTSHEARGAVIDVVFAGMVQREVEAATACDFYADLTLSSWTSPQLNRKMFHRLSEVANFARMLKQFNKK
ncbi:MAG: hypothetical protein JSS49_01425 [Planctomycetes bacterium]|nr:hypothetical protein [Planctomycetota bacterium]